LSSDGSGYDIVEIDTVILGDLVNVGLIAPQFSLPDNHTDWYSAATSAVQFNQAVYAYPHLMCAYFIFTRDEQVAKVTTVDQLINILSVNATANYHLIGNLNSSWELPALWIISYQNSNNMGSNIEAFALHSYQSSSFSTMRKLAQLCERTGGENNCLNGVFRGNSSLTSLLFANKQTAAIFGYSERLFFILENSDPDDYSNIKLTPLPIGTTGNQPIFFTDAFVFRRNMSDNVLNAARLFAEFMGTPRMQAAVVGSGDSPNTKPRYLLPISKNAYNEPILANDRFYQQYFRNLDAGYPFPTAGFANTRKDIEASIIKYLDGKNPRSSASNTIPIHLNLCFLLFFIYYLFHQLIM
jgi:thiamine pyridinylase